MPIEPDRGNPLWGAPEPKWSGKVRVIVLVVASLATWEVIAGGVYLITRWAAG